MFFHHAKTKTYDASRWKPVIRVSICTGEETAGFKSLANHTFKEVCLIRSGKDIEAFRKEYGIEGEIERIW